MTAGRTRPRVRPAEGAESRPFPLQYYFANEYVCSPGPTGPGRTLSPYRGLLIRERVCPARRNGTSCIGMEPSTEVALECLVSLGFRVEQVPQNVVKRADLRAWWGDAEEYLIEAKERFDGAEFKELMRKISDEGMGTLSRKVEASNAFSRKLMKAAAQLKETPVGSSAVRLIWLYAGHPDATHELECVQRRLLGTAQLVVINPEIPSVDGVKTCYGFYTNDFRRMPHVHGAVLCSPRGLSLLVNPYSIDQQNLRGSQLYQLMAGESAVVDPEREEERGGAWLVANNWDCFDSPPDATAYVNRKYNRRFNQGERIKS